jgi:1-acyl-sn-glycerol-3-phosphate acyltransferase
LKGFKTGAARMSLEAGVPIIPLVVWGAQRIWTKDHPKHIGRNKIPITVAVDPPYVPSGTIDAVMAELREEMTALLHRVQADYPHPDGEYWVPRRLGGSAPTMEEARVLDDTELAERARRQAEKR